MLTHTGLLVTHAGLLVTHVGLLATDAGLLVTLAGVSFFVIKYDTIITCNLITTHTTLISCTCNNAEMIIIDDSFMVILIIS